MPSFFTFAAVLSTLSLVARTSAMPVPSQTALNETSHSSIAPLVLNTTLVPRGIASGAVPNFPKDVPSCAGKNADVAQTCKCADAHLQLFLDSMSASLASDQLLL